MKNNNNSNKQCQVCFTQKSNEIFVRCCMCGLGIHSTCYGCSFTTNSSSFNGWKCRYCHAICVGTANDYTDKINKTIKCRICNQSKFGALKSCGKKQGFAHLVCALWTPWTFIENTYNMAPIRGIEKCKQYKSVLKQLICSICRKSNATLKCRLKSCSTYYHPLCLIQTYRNCMIETHGIIDQCQCKIYYAYCPNHRQKHQEWNQNEGRKNGKSREIVFIVPVNKQSTNINNSRQTRIDANPCVINDICMTNSNNNDADSDIIVLNDASNNNNLPTPESLPTPQPLINNTMTPQPQPQPQNQQILSSFICSDNIIDVTPMPEIPMDIASQWTERFQNNNFCMSDRDSICGFNNNLYLRDYSPLTMGKQMSPIFDNINGFNNIENDFQFDSFSEFNGFVTNENKNNSNNVNTNINTNIIINNNQNKNVNVNANENEDLSMYSVPKLDQKNSRSGSSTNSTFCTMSINHSPHTINSPSTLSTPRNYDVDLTSE